jgi:lipoyl synthase
MKSDTQYMRKPEWLKIHIESGESLRHVKETLSRFSLNTVCTEANCPNKMECFNNGTATFLIMGSVCTRSCRFCNIKTGITEQLDPDEPEHIAEAVEALGLKHVVITSVTRDDLSDGGSSHFASVIRELRKLDSKPAVEVLIPDFQGDEEGLKKVLAEKPDVLNHNVETVPRLYPEVRPQAVYSRSLELLRRAKEIDSLITTKSGFMVGLGEKKEEVIRLMEELCKNGCHLLTIGQYIAPSAEHYPVVEYVKPEDFLLYRKAGLAMGFKSVASAPLVRSSYHAAEMRKKPR